MLGGRRTIIITDDMRTVRRKPESKSAAVAKAEPGTVGQVLECPDETGWCEIEIDGHRGWLRRVEFWGVYQDEIIK